MQVNEFKPKIVAFCCNWCSYAGADLAGTNRLNYPADVKIIRVPCSCRVNPMFILRAFQRGADAIIHAATIMQEEECRFCSPCLIIWASRRSAPVWSGSLRQRAQNLLRP